MPQDDQNRRPRLTDVAAIAGVSMKTVSNVIHGHPYVTDDTRDRVNAAIEQVGYRPNLSARNLARGRSGVIALVVPRLEMPYFAALAGQLMEAAEERGWFVLMHQSEGSREVELRALEGRFPQRIDGLIISAEHLSTEDLGARQNQIPLVMLGEIDYAGTAHHVGIDNVAAARAAVDHLLSSGRRRIAMIGSSQELGSGSRTQGYLDSLHAAGLSSSERLMRPVAENSGEEGQRAMAELLDGGESPDGVFAVTDWVALGAVRELRARGMDVPEDVAVVGFDDIPYTRVSSPSLTTITPDRPAIAKQAVAMLDVQMSRGETPRNSGTSSHAGPESCTEVQVPFALTVRESAP